jgi:hypothetical protein
VRDAGAGRPREVFGPFPIQVVDCGDLDAFIIRKDRGVNTGDVTSADETDLYFGHKLLQVQIAESRESVPPA